MINKNTNKFFIIVPVVVLTLVCIFCSIFTFINLSANNPPYTSSAQLVYDFEQSMLPICCTSLVVAISVAGLIYLFIKRDSK